MRLRTGRELQVIDVGNGGALVEGVVRLLPGTHVDVHIVTRHGRVLVRSRVTRAHVSYLTADTIRYRAAVAFESPVDTSGLALSETRVEQVEGYVVPEEAHGTLAVQGREYPGNAGLPAGGEAVRLSA